MEDREQMLSSLKPSAENGQEVARSPSASPDHSTTEASHRVASLPDRPATRSTDSMDCSECISAMAHCLAQTMTALRGGIELALLGKHSAADYRSLLEQCLQLADNMAQLIVSLRDLGDSGASGGPPQYVSLETMAEQILGEMDGLAQARDLRLQLRTAGMVKVSANPGRLREALQSLLTWVIQNSAGSGVIAVDLSVSEGEGQMYLSPPRLDLQYLQIKVLTDIATPGLLFSRAAKSGSLGWVINQRLLDGLGGKLEMVVNGPDAGCIRVRLPLAPAG